NRFERQFIDGSDFARDSVMAKAIRPIRTDFCIQDRAVRAAFKAADVRAGKREARSKLLRWRRQVNEILQPVVDDLHFWSLALNFRLAAGKNRRGLKPGLYKSKLTTLRIMGTASGSARHFEKKPGCRRSRIAAWRDDRCPCRRQSR